MTQLTSLKNALPWRCQGRDENMDVAGEKKNKLCWKIFWPKLMSFSASTELASWVQIIIQFSNSWSAHFQNIYRRRLIWGCVDGQQNFSYFQQKNGVLWTTVGSEKWSHNFCVPKSLLDFGWLSGDWGSFLENTLRTPLHIWPIIALYLNCDQVLTIDK